MNRFSVVGFQSILRVESNRQIKRRINHPTQIRHRLREAAARPAELNDQVQQQMSQVLELKYKPTYQPENVSWNGWSPAPTEPVIDDLPFQVKRTVKGMQLPVYRSYKNGQTRVMTSLRRFKGDTAELAIEMSKVCGGEPVFERPGRLEVQGDFANDIKKWLVGLGF